MKRTLFVILALLAMILVISACATPTEAPKPPASSSAAPSSAASSAPAAAAKFAFWHSMGGTNGEAIAEMMKRFNASQTQCVGEAIFQGSYDDSLNKLKAGLQSKDVPAVVQQFDLATQVLVDLNVITPMQNFIDKDKFDLKDFEQNVLAYYTVDGKLYGMPYNTSNPMLYYNKDAFKAAGLDPAKPPRTYAEVTEAAKKLTKKGADGKVAMYGYSMAIYGWFFEQLLAASGGLYLNNGNGRDARATAATFNSPEGVKILTWWKEGYDAGVFGNFGRPTADTQKAFDAQQTAMMIESTAGLRSRLNAAQGKFELGTGLLPRPDEDAFKKSGTIIGGASVYIMKDRPEAEQNCAWQFVKFTVSPAIQAYWHTASGYYPVTKKSYDEKDDKDWVAQYPQFLTAVDQLHMAPNIRATQGGLTGVMPAARQRIELAIEEVIQGKATPKEALDKAATDVSKLIVDYNKSVGK